MFISGYTNTENIFYCYGSEGNTGFVCILKVLESPCLNFKIKIALKVLENCSWGWKVLEFQCLLYPTQRTQRNLQDEIAHVLEELKKDSDSRLFFCSEWSPWPVGNVLETPWKVLEFFVQKRIHANLENSKFASTFLYLLIYNIIIFTLMLILL